MISATMVAANTYEVIVEAEVETLHTVTLSGDYHRQLCGGTLTHEWVLIQAFRFLLEHEPNTEILRSFDLEDINRYYPEFEDEMRRRLSQ